MHLFPCTSVVVFCFCVCVCVCYGFYDVSYMIQGHLGSSRWSTLDPAWHPTGTKPELTNPHELPLPTHHIRIAQKQVLTI